MNELQFQYTSLLLLVFSVMAGLNQFFGDPIQCDLPGGGVSSDTLKNYCWMYSTFNIPEDFEGSCARSSNSDTPVYNTYYQWVPIFLIFQVALKYEVRLALDGANSGVHFTGKVFPIDVPNDEVVGLKHDILSFSTAQALQSRRSDVNGAHFIRLSYAVTKKYVRKNLKVLSPSSVI